MSVSVRFPLETVRKGKKNERQNEREKEDGVEI